MSTPIPSVGRVVHFGILRAGAIEARPATIVRVNGTADDSCNLHVMFDGPNDDERWNITGPNSKGPWQGSVARTETLEAGKWCWPPFVAPKSLDFLSGDGPSRGRPPFSLEPAMPSISTSSGAYVVYSRPALIRIVLPRLPDLGAVIDDFADDMRDHQRALRARLVAPPARPRRDTVRSRPVPVPTSLRRARSSC